MNEPGFGPGQERQHLVDRGRGDDRGVVEHGVEDGFGRRGQTGQKGVQTYPTPTASTVTLSSLPALSASSTST